MATKVQATAKSSKAKKTPTTARRSTGTVKKRGWSLKKFVESVTNAAKKAEVPAKSISKGVIEKAYNDGLAVKATVGKLAG